MSKYIFKKLHVHLLCAKIQFYAKTTTKYKYTRIVRVGKKGSYSSFTVFNQIIVGSEPTPKVSF